MMYLAQKENHKIKYPLLKTRKYAFYLKISLKENPLFKN